MSSLPTLVIDKPQRTKISRCVFPIHDTQRLHRSITSAAMLMKTPAACTVNTSNRNRRSVLENGCVLLLVAVHLFGGAVHIVAFTN